jgi:dolichol-phosphate mannosyltransferase
MVVILPAYNEEKNIEKVLDKLADKYKVLVVDDGSTDSTSEIIKKYKVNIITHSKNEGLGKALYDGFKWAIDNNEDIAVTMDADNTMDIGLIPVMAEKIKNNNAQIVIASRYAKNAVVKNVPLYRKVISSISSFICRLVFHLKEVKDFSSGYRAYDVRCLSDAISYWNDNFITSDGFDCQIEILRKLSCFVNSISEIPIVLDYQSKINNSHFKFFKTAKGYLHQLYCAIKGE